MDNIIRIKTDKTLKGDQPNAVKKLVDNFVNKGIKKQVLLGATGTGKTFTVANVISQLNKKALVLAPNKTLAAQLYMEIKDLFPENRVEYFVSYFDFYQPEAYVVKSDTYIEKTSVTNSEIELLRVSTFNSLVEREDVIVVASVAAIYSSSSPEQFKQNRIIISIKDKTKYSELKSELVRLNYERNDIDQKPGTFKITGDILEVSPPFSNEFIYRLSFFGEEIEEIAEIDPITKKVIKKYDFFVLPAAKEYISDATKSKEWLSSIRMELKERISYFKENNRLIEAQRIEERTNHDMDALEELGYCSGIENYSRHLESRKEGETPFTLFNYFGDDWILIVDESHLMIPQIHGMHNTDRSRKMNLIEYGFRLPSSIDNRPLKFEEFYEKLDKVIYVSATPSEWEKEDSSDIVEQIVRPTGLLDPIIKVLPSENQIIKVLELIKATRAKDERVLITVLTIRMAEELTAYLKDNNIKCQFLHNEIKTMERLTILNQLRKGIFDVVIGINLLREGLDLPEVSTVIIIDADKQGLFRNTKSLIQTIGRASRNSKGTVYMFADKITPAMKEAIEETNRRRLIQEAFNKEHNITPKTIIRSIENISKDDNLIIDFSRRSKDHKKTPAAKKQLINGLKIQMKSAAKNQEYERAAYLRDLIFEAENE
ncbi:MAG: excinuclease ABC subunit UvrB [Mycoplasmoidaceae bacterium]